MACACKVNQEINKIQKYYSYNGKERDKGARKMSINKMFLFVVGFSIFSKDGKINVSNFLGFIHNTRNGRKQQIV